MKRAVLAILIFSFLFGALWAQQPAPSGLAPPEIAGKAVYVPFPVAITLDGKLDDWAGVPIQTVDRGPMISKDPAKNGSFSFAVAADDKNFYVLMLAKDRNILAGAHGADTWNEDSLEFYLNLSGNLGTRKYLRDIIQYRVTPSDIGNEDLSKIHVSGSNYALHPLKAKIFKTDEGWGFEGSVELPTKLTPAHGLEIGFQAQLNGASTKDRDVKLIWSLADTSDNSWQDPSLFGRALFFKTGSADIPKPSVVAIEEPKPKPKAPAAPLVAIDQVGYFPKARKLASIAAFGSGSLPWTLADATSGKVVASGSTSAGPYDLLSGDAPQIADFSSFSRSGSYYIVIDDRKSPVFKIGDDILSGLAVDSLKYFYRSRSGIALDAKYAGAAWARDAGHLTDSKVAVFAGRDAAGEEWPGFDFLVDGSGGWYDAGDYGKYVVNGGIAVWSLQDAYEREGAAFGDGQLGIPESGNGRPDILDEARWELEFMLRMQIPEGQTLAGMCFHKLHDRKWAAMPCALPSEVDNNVQGKDGWSWGRFAYEPTTAATLNLAACAAQASRVWAKLDGEFSARCLAAAKSAWKAALANPAVLAKDVPGDGGGDYIDGTVSDEFFWAASELLATTGEVEYLQFIESSPGWKAIPGLDGSKESAMSWANTAALGAITLVSSPVSALPAKDRDYLAAQILSAADRYAERSNANAYGAPMGVEGYVWGSNSCALNDAIVLAVAYGLSGKSAYREAVARTMDYVLGCNALRKCFVTGYGAYPVEHPHHRLWANDPDSGYPAPPPGVLAGGPDKSLEDPEMKAAGLSGLPIAKRYLDTIGSFATNEVAINWNASLAWVANWLESSYR